MTLPVMAIHFRQISPFGADRQPSCSARSNPADGSGTGCPAAGDGLASAGQSGRMAGVSFHALHQRDDQPAGENPWDYLAPADWAGSGDRLLRRVVHLVVAVSKVKRRLVNYTLIAGLALGSVGAWSAGLRQADGVLHIRILPSTSSPALILQTPAGSQLMLNGVSEARLLSSVVLPAFNRHLDSLWITHPDPLIIDGIHTALQTVPVDGVYWGLMGEGNSETRWLESDLRQLGTTSAMLEKGGGFELDGATVRVINITGSARAIVIRYGKFEFFIPDGLALRESLKTNRNPTVLLLSPADLGNLV